MISVYFYSKMHLYVSLNLKINRTEISKWDLLVILKENGYSRLIPRHFEGEVFTVINEYCTVGLGTRKRGLSDSLRELVNKKKKTSFHYEMIKKTIHYTILR